MCWSVHVWAAHGSCLVSLRLPAWWPVTPTPDLEAYCGVLLLLLLLLLPFSQFLVQLPAVICRGVTVVVCPLLSLMQDQVSMTAAAAAYPV
jgi:hypothetical protein